MYCCMYYTCKMWIWIRNLRLNELPDPIQCDEMCVGFFFFRKEKSGKYRLTAIIYSWAIRYSSTVNGNGIRYSLINIVLLIVSHTAIGTLLLLALLVFTSESLSDPKRGRWAARNWNWLLNLWLCFSFHQIFKQRQRKRKNGNIEKFDKNEPSMWLMW